MSAKNRTADMSGYSVRNLFGSTFEVSSDDWKLYYVRVEGGKWVCSCPDHTFRGTQCKHILLVKATQAEIAQEATFGYELAEHHNASVEALCAAGNEGLTEGMAEPEIYSGMTIDVTCPF